MAGSTWTYNPEALNTPLFQARFLIGDTGDGNDWRLSDQEISAFLPGGFLAQSSVVMGAAAICDTLAARYAGLVDISEGGASASLSQLHEHYRDLAVQIRSRLAAQAPAYAQPEIITGERAPAFTRLMNGAVWP